MAEIPRKPLPSSDVLHQILRYDPETGQLWRRSKGTPRSTGLEYLAGSVDNRGYAVVGIKNFRYGAHRVIWKMLYGTDPEDDIDHVNNNRIDNRPGNLRLADRFQNHHNIKLSRRNSSGVKGVGWNKNEEKWTARIQCHGKKIFIGYFPSKEEAEEAVKKEREKHHKQFTNHG